MIFIKQAIFTETSNLKTYWSKPSTENKYSFLYKRNLNSQILDSQKSVMKSEEPCLELKAICLLKYIETKPMAIRSICGPSECSSTSCLTWSFHSVFILHY
jgi:hypothetical protein